MLTCSGDLVLKCKIAKMSFFYKSPTSDYDYSMTMMMQQKPQSSISGKAHWLALGGIIGPVLFVLAFTFAGFIRTGYSPIQTAISALGVGSNAWLEDVPAFLLGLTILGFVISFF